MPSAELRAPPPPPGEKYTPRDRPVEVLLDASVGAGHLRHQEQLPDPGPVENF